MIQSYIHLFLLSLLGSIIALCGGIIFLYSQKWSKLLEKNSIPFAAGVLITISLLGLLPESLELIGNHAFMVVLLSFFSANLFEHLVFSIHHHGEHDHAGHDHGQKYASSVPMIIVGDTIHNYIDGVAIGASFLISPALGLITALATFFHEVPHEIGDFGVLLKAGWKKRHIILINVISAIFTILGAFSLLVFAENQVLIGTLLGISAGIFLYLGAADFLPHSVEGFNSRFKAIIPLVLGASIMIGIMYLIPHAHEEEPIRDSNTPINISADPRTY